MQTPAPGAGLRLSVLGMTTGMIMGAGIGARSLVDDSAGLWIYGLLFGAGAGVVLGMVVAGLSAAVVVARVRAASTGQPPFKTPVAVWWQLLVPVPAASGLAWWVLQSPTVSLRDRVLLTAAVAAACAAVVVLTSRWVLSPPWDGAPDSPARRQSRVSS